MKTNIILKRKYKKDVIKKLTAKKNLFSIDKMNDNNKEVVSFNSTSDNTIIINNKTTDLSALSDSLESNNDDRHYYIYQKIRIFEPEKTIVKQQINNTKVKILIFKTNIEQKLITLDILDSECSLADILEKINIKFDDTIRLSLVEDTKYNINYIIEFDFVEFDLDDEKINNSHDELNDPTYDTSKYNNELVDRINDLDSSYQNDLSYNLTIDKNTNYNDNLQTNPILNNDIPISSIIKVIEKAKYYDTELAMCNHCFYPSINFNHCYYCEKKIECNPKTIPNILSEEQIKIMKLNIANYYNNWYNNLYKNIMNNDNIAKQNDENKKSILSSTNKTTNQKKNCNKTPRKIFLLPCRSIKIGSYNYVDNSNNVSINKNGFTLSVVILKNQMSIVKIKIRYEDIIEAKFYFKNELNVLFYKTNINVGLNIGKLLGMKLTTGPIYDPVSEDPTRNMITLVFDNLSDELRGKLTHQLLKSSIGQVVKLEKKAAHDLLVETSGGLRS